MIDEIKDLEEQIRQAQLANDTNILTQILSDDLQFVLFDGSVASKQDDINAHQQKLFLFHEIKFTEQVIKMFKDLASVTVLAEIKGTMNGSSFHRLFRYGRTWSKLNGRWQLISGCVFPVGRYSEVSAPNL